MKTTISSISAIFIALIASTCCIAPLIALAGIIGASASQVIWLSSIKNYLIMGSLAITSYNLYRAYYPRTEQNCCTSELAESTSSLNNNRYNITGFFKSKTFLWITTVITIAILIIPYL